MNYLSLLGRKTPLFELDLELFKSEIDSEVASSRFMVIGGAGSVGQAVVREIFKRKPKVLHVVDISENNMVELVRDIRSTFGYIPGDFRTFAIDSSSIEFEALIAKEGPYDYILNLSALKHVRSEKDPYTLMRMIDVNILNAIKALNFAGNCSSKKYFCVSTDKAANPVNMMGASKRMMEKYLMHVGYHQPVSTARFANVAFSDGSLLHGFNQRCFRRQPIAVPLDIKRYFVTPQESGELCLMSCILGETQEIYFPKLNPEEHLVSFVEILDRYLDSMGYEIYACESEVEARCRSEELIAKRKWPCYFYTSDTTGEKEFEEFFTAQEITNFDKYKDIGVIKHTSSQHKSDDLDSFIDLIIEYKKSLKWDKSQLVDLFKSALPEFQHHDTGKYLDEKM